MIIAILQEPGLSSRGITGHIAEWLAAYPDVSVQCCTTADILAQGIPGEVFCNGHGEIYPVAIEESLLEFFRRGGGLLHLGGAPFETAMARGEDGQWTPVVRTFGDLRRHKGPGPLDAEIDAFRTQLGLMLCAPAIPLEDIPQLSLAFDSELVGLAPLAGFAPMRGVTLSNTIPMAIPHPEMALDYYNTYMAKPVCRESHPAGVLREPGGMAMATVLLFTKSWGNPYSVDQDRALRPWAIYSGELAGPPPAALLAAMLRWLSLPVVLTELHPEYATLHRGETVRAITSLHGTLPPTWTVKGYCARATRDAYLAGQPFAWEEVPVTCEDGQISLVIADDPDAWLLPIRVALVDEHGIMRDYSDSAIVPWQPEAIREAVRLRTNGAYFDVQTPEKTHVAAWLPGTNWQDRYHYAWTWHQPNALRIAEDARVLAEAGMVLIRAHYFMPEWMRVNGERFYAEMLPTQYTDFERGPALSEKHLRAIEAHLMLFNSLGLVLNPTVYTNVGSLMGNSSFWMHTARAFALPSVRENQRIFAEQIMARFGAYPGICWDLYNEADTEMALAGDWLRDLRTIWGREGHLVGIGAFRAEHNILLGEAADWHSIHNPCCSIGDVFQTGKPCLFQEAWVPTPTTPTGEDDIERYLHRAISWSLQFGSAGFMPWNWNMFMCNWRDQVSFVEFWDNELGCAVHADNTPRRGLLTLRNWARLLDGVSFAQADAAQVRLVAPAQCIDETFMTVYTQALRQQKIPFLALNDADVATADLSQTRLIILPHYAYGFRQATWERLLAFAEAGGMVWAHNDTVMNDEHGRYVAERQIPLREGRCPLGKGMIVYQQGMPSSGLEYGIAPFVQLLDTLSLERRDGNVLPLANGGTLRFTEVWSTDERTMASDWNPLTKLPDRNVVQRVEVIDHAGQMQRGWAGEGANLQLDEWTVSSPAPFFAIRHENGHWLLTGHAFELHGGTVPPNSRLVAWEHVTGLRPLDAPLTWERKENAWQLTLAPWERLYWVELS